MREFGLLILRYRYIWHHHVPRHGYLLGRLNTPRSSGGTSPLGDLEEKPSDAAASATGLLYIYGYWIACTTRSLFNRSRNAWIVPSLQGDFFFTFTRSDEGVQGFLRYDHLAHQASIEFCAVITA